MNVADSFSRAVLHYAEKTALIFENRSYTYGQMNRIIDNLVIYLARSGVQQGDRVALFMANRPEWILLYYAAARLGAISVCVPAAYKTALLSKINFSIK